MKLATGILFLITSAFANESVVLNDSVIQLDSSSATLEKTIDTPKVVNLLVPVERAVIKCEEGYNRRVRKANAEKCGYDIIDVPCSNIGDYRDYRDPRYNPPGGRRAIHTPRPHNYNRGERRVIRTAPRSNIRVGVGITVRPAPRPAPRSYCYNEARRVPRVCSYNVCDRPYTEVEVVDTEFSITFENYERDESFEFSLNEHGDVTLLPLATNPACTGLSIFGKKPYVTGAKISIKDSWWNWRCE
ncbi:MAG: hypothetical protein KC478_10420 [Bacteriovoracaceae bacterium]|nr:hypothetical protein [Bacteriovoracaceae bacterium]